MKKIKTESAEEIKRTKRKIELFGDDEEGYILTLHI